MEKRRALRQKTFLRGFVYFGNNPAVDCTVRDISATGARLKFSGAPVSAETLELYIPIKGRRFRAKVQWCRGDEIGIAFCQSSATPAAIEKHTSDVLLAKRVHQVDAEIALLKETIESLRKNTDPKADVHSI